MSKPRAKRRLSDISFEHEGAAVALVSSEIGGPANGRDVALIMKSTSKFSEDFIEKAQKVRVTLELPEFLRKFFDLWSDEADLLAQMMGYVPEDPEYKYEAEHQEYIESKLESFEILKSAYESESIAEVLSNLNEDSYMTMLRDQEVLEKAFAKVDSAKEEIAKAALASEQPVVAETQKSKARIVQTEEENHKATVTDVEKSSDEASQAKTAGKAETQTEVKQMTDKSVKVEKTKTAEMVEKSQYALIEKANLEMKEEIAKSTAIIAEFQKERKEAIDKSRVSALVEVLESDEKAQELFKAVGELESEGFEAVVSVLKSLKVAVEADPIFKETGITGANEDQADAKTALRKSLEAKYNTK